MELTEEQKAKWHAHIEEMEKAEAKAEPLSKRKASELIPFFFLLASKRRYYGKKDALESLVEGVDDEFAMVGLKMLVDCVDRDHLASTLATKKRALLQRFKTRLDLMEHAILGVEGATNPKLLEEECRAFLVEH